jgi:hypothetical protein
VKRFLKRTLPLSVQAAASKFFHRFHPHPMEQVVRQLRRRGVPLSELTALEVFGRDGRWHTRYYARLVRSIEVWEIDEQYREALNYNLPMAKVKITDSFVEINCTGQLYDLIVLDNPIFGDAKDPSDYCEHFDLFPAVFRVASDSAVLIVNVIPKQCRVAREKYPHLLNSTHLERRASFYQTNKPENIPVHRMVRTYTALAQGNGFEIEWYFSQSRGLVHYLVLKLSRKSQVKASTSLNT